MHMLMYVSFFVFVCLYIHESICMYIYSYFFAKRENSIIELLFTIDKII